jgi:hypothetical protein
LAAGSVDNEVMGIGRALIIIGLLLVLVGVIVSVAGRFTPLGRLPGDIVVRRQNFTFYFPLATSLILSLVVTLLLWLFSRR